jgi:hypothetical protein
MHSDFDDPDPSRWDHAEWGRASVALGATQSVMVPLALILIQFLDVSGFQWPKVMVFVATAGGYAAGAILVGLSLAGLSFGVTATGRARRRGRPPALGLAGMMLNGFALFGWLGGIVAWSGIVLERL